MKRHLAILFLMIPFMLTAAGKDTPNPVETYHINGIEIKLNREGKYYHALADAVIPVKIGFLWEALTNFERHPEFIPTIKKLKISRLEGENRYLLESTQKLPFMTMKLVTINTLEVKECCKVRRWEQRKGILSVNYGSWTLTEAGNGSTRAVYEQVMYHPLLSRHTVNRLITKNLPDLYTQFTGQAMKLEKERRLQQK